MLLYWWMTKRQCLRIMMCALEVSEREKSCHFGASGWVFALWDWSLRVTRSSLCLERVSFSILSPLSRGNCSPCNFHLTTIGVSDNCSVINSDWGTMCRIAVCLPPRLRWLWFSSTWAINGTLRPCGLEGRMVAQIVSHVPSAAQPEPDGWSGQDTADWEASRLRADVAYTLVISREYSW